MKALAMLLSALLFGLVAYFCVGWIWPEMKPSAFTNLIGVVALVGGFVGMLLSKWLGSGKED
jgi:hypothetical protein